MSGIAPLAQLIAPKPTVVERIAEWGKPTTGVLIILLYGIVHIMALMHMLPDPTLNQLIGTDEALIVLIVGFYFGSSSSSQRKDETIAQAQTALANSTPAIPPLQPPGGTVTTTVRQDPPNTKEPP